jgi:hypothetical protein
MKWLLGKISNTEVLVIEKMGGYHIVKEEIPKDMDRSIREWGLPKLWKWPLQGKGDPFVRNDFD